MPYILPAGMSETMSELCVTVGITRSKRNVCHLHGYIGLSENRYPSSIGETAINLGYTHIYPSFSEGKWASPQPDSHPSTPDAGNAGNAERLSPLRVLQDFSEQRHRHIGVELLGGNPGAGDRWAPFLKP